MTRRIRWTERAARDLERLDRRTQQRIMGAVERLAEMGYGDVKRLRGSEAEWRLRVGGLRVRFIYADRSEEIQILRVLPRGRAYRE